MKADSASLFRPAESGHVAFKAAVYIETSVTDHTRPYPECLCWYCIQIMLTEPSYSCQEKTQHDKSRDEHMSIRKNAVICRVTSWSNLVQWQPPDGSRIASDIKMGTDVTYFISYNLRGEKKKMLYNTLLVYNLFFQKLSRKGRIYLDSHKSKTLDKTTVSLSATIWAVAWMAIMLNLDDDHPPRKLAQYCFLIGWYCPSS